MRYNTSIDIEDLDIQLNIYYIKLIIHISIISTKFMFLKKKNLNEIS